MQRIRDRYVLVILLGLSASAGTYGASPVADFHPDPLSVQRYGPAYRYPQAGWIVLHIEGEPYERGYQHGRLLAPEIAACVRCSAAMQSPTAPTEGWKNTRLLVNALFLRRYQKEYLEEMKGIADGAAAAGAKFDNRHLDLVDIVALNSWVEVDFLDAALEATPTGLEGIRFRHRQPRPMPAASPSHCSAFAATGPATADGKIVIGHITMWGLYPSSFFNVWIDVKPTKGHRVIMQGYPGAIQSGLDYYMNDAGLIVVETTLAQTHFDINGTSEVSRIRQALQYADTIDKAVAILRESNNGLYTNEWLLADVKTNEIAMFELGTAKSKLYRSSKNEWFGGTEGFYWGCNNTKDLAVRLETIPGVHGRPANMVFCPTDRDQTWLRLFNKYKGRIDADFGKEAFTTPPLAAYPSVDAKFTTTDMAKDLKSWALFGPPLGRSWQPTDEERKKYPEIRPLVGNPWTILHMRPPPKADPIVVAAVDLPEPANSSFSTAKTDEEEKQAANVPAWHGTILPKTDADIWLATAFADYEKIVAQENAGHEGRIDADTPPEPPTKNDRDRLGVSLFAHRSGYLAGARALADVPLAKTRSEVGKSDWYRVASGKGVLLLSELRRLLGNAAFEEALDSFGREHAGKEVTVAQFQDHMERANGKTLKSFFHYWLEQAGLPTLRLGQVTAAPNGKGFRVEGELFREGPDVRTTVPVTVETAKGEETETVTLDSARASFSIETERRPERIVVDKYGATAKANGGVFSISSFLAELEQTLIVYGTADEASANREAAEVLQRALVERWSNYSVPVKADKDVAEPELKTHHLLLIGRPDSNALVNRFRAALPVRFGSRSFQVRGDNYAHAGSAVIAAAENPLNSRFSIVVLAGLGAESTLQAPALFRNRSQQSAEVMILPNKGKAHGLVVPAADLVRELGPTKAVSATAP
jgi:hypothetical protein